MASNGAEPSCDRDLLPVAPGSHRVRDECGAYVAEVVVDVAAGQQRLHFDSWARVNAWSLRALVGFVGCVKLCRFCAARSARRRGGGPIAPDRPPILRGSALRITILPPGVRDERGRVGISSSRFHGTLRRMSSGVSRGVQLDPRAARQVEALSLTLSKLPVHAPVADVFNAIRPYMPLAAGLFSIIRPSAPDSIVTQGVWLPPQVLESWIGTPDDQLALTLAPVIRSEPGSLWRDRETVTGAFREQLEVLHRLDAAGLGEGAGYKVLQRTSPWHGVEHFLLAMILERGARVPPHAPAVLAALNPALSATILRIGLPLVESIPIFAQITAERLIGYACFSFGGTLLAANGRAHKLVMRFRDAARVERGSGKLVLEEFAARARLFASHGRTWRLDADEPRSLLDVGVHRLSKETHPLPEDVLLLVMHEVFLAEPSADELFGRAGLTSREKEIAFRLVRTSALAKQMAAELSLSEGTVNTHIKHVYRKLGVRSRQELVLLLKK